jgi:hypothetical protein
LHQAGDSEISFSTREIKAQLGDIPINSPQGISAVRKSVEKVKEQLKSLASREVGAYAVGNG